MSTFLQDLRYGFRVLAKTPGFTAVAVLTLALAIGANTAIFTVVNAVLLRPLPFHEPDRLAVVWESKPSLGIDRENFSPADFADMRDQSRSFEQMAAAYYWSPGLTGVSEPEKLWGLRVSSNLFDLLGVRPQLGRGFVAGEDDRGRSNVVVLGYGLWQRRFARDPDILGRSLILDGQSFQVVGVMPPGFRFPPFWATKAELWAPLGFDARQWRSRNGRMLRVFARLKAGVAPRQAGSEVANIAGRLARDYPDADAGLSATVVPLMEMVVGETRPALLTLQVAVGFLLLIASANLANLLIARALARRKEFAIRLALGAARRRLVRQVLAETLLLALAGGLAGLILSVWGLSYLLGSLPDTARFTMPRAAEIGIDGRVFGFVLVVSLLVAAVSTLAATARTWRNESLTGPGQRATGDAGQHRLRSFLVVSQVALSLILLIGAGLLGKSFIRLLNVDPGFDATNVLAMSVSSPFSPSEPERREAFFRQVLERVRSLPGVQRASAINHLPLVGDQWGVSFIVGGRPLPEPGRAPSATWRVVDPAYFSTMRISLLKGRYFRDTDDSQAASVVIINESFARRFFPNEDPVGQRIKLGNRGEHASWSEIVGVVAGVKQTEWAEAPGPEMYVPMAQNPLWRMTRSTTLVVRTTPGSAGVATAAREAVWEIRKDAIVFDVIPMERVASEAVSQPRFNMLLLVIFAAVAVSLAAAGIYGVVSHAVSSRARELGIRSALGARPAALLALVLGQGLKLTIMGLAAGVLAAFALSRFLSGLLYQVSAGDPLIFVSSALFLAVVALIATFVPARQAAKVDPMTALRQE